MEKPKNAPLGGAGIKAPVEMLWLSICLKDTGDPELGHLRHLRALTSGLPTFITTPYFLGDQEIQTSHHNIHMGEKSVRWFL